MGCDGGTIPRRDELVKVKKKPEKKDKESELSFRWRHCAISQQPLRNPIVACSLGRIYCKESVLEGLLDRTKLPETASHITSLKDVRELVLTPNPAYATLVNGEKGESGRYVDHRASPYVCPVINLELSGMFRFAFPWSCGCVVSDKALKEVPSKLCHKCQKPVTQEEFVYLNAEGEVLKQMQARMEERKTLAKANKKNKKDKKQKQPASATVTSADDSSSSTDVQKSSSNEDEPKDSQKSSSNEDEPKDSEESNTPMEINFVAAKEPELDKTKEESNVKADKSDIPEISPVENVDLVKVKIEEVLEKKLTDKEEKKAPKRSHSPHRSESRHDRKDKHDKDDKYRREHKDDRKSSRDRKSRDHRSSKDEHRSSKDRKHKDHKSGKIEAICDPAYKKSKSEYSVANDPRASKVYKSLFTSHADAKSQTKAHWVTYNPFYN